MIKFIKFFTIITIAALISSCTKEEEIQTGSIVVNFDNIALVNNVEQQLSLVTPLSTAYNYTNELGQKFNINLLRYYISSIVLDGPDGAHYEDVMNASVAGAKGYYLIDEAKPSSQLVTLENIPTGSYNKISFTVGVDSTGVADGAVGGVLDLATCNMFWSWNSGYVALKFEGQSDVSVGGVGGAETVTSNNPNGIAYHIGGWKDIPNSAFVYNNQHLKFTFDENVNVSSSNEPEIHMTFDVLKLFKGHHTIDITGNHNVHKPSDGMQMAHNMGAAFQFDHIHQ